MLKRSRESFDIFVFKSELKIKLAIWGLFLILISIKNKKRRENIHEIETVHDLEKLRFQNKKKIKYKL